MSYDDDDNARRDTPHLRWGTNDDWMNSMLRLADGNSYADVATRDVSSLTVGQLAERSSDLPHRKRETIVINGTATKETLKERLTREAKEAETAILTLAGKLTRRQEQLKHLERFPDKDPFADGTTLIFQKGFPSNPDTKYSYSAVRVDGTWYVTGNRSPQGVTWDEFVSWMGLGVDEIYRVTAAKGSVKKVIG